MFWILLISPFIEKSSPGRWVVKNLVVEVCQGVLNKIKEDVEEKDIFVALDERRDHQGRSMTTILIVRLDGHFCGRPYLSDLIDIQIANANNVKNIVIGSVYKLLLIIKWNKRFVII
uniref:DUF659 domain-containing protein n=1 Tax=Lepeophtheirus salmonis TaxID=72036 RepID=A0A0K2TKY0_LEPSM